MSEKLTDEAKRLNYVINTCWNRTQDATRGYMEPGGYGFGGLAIDAGDSYVNSCILTTGVVKMDEGKFPLDQGLENIVSYDRAEKNDAYIGEINMIQTSSFNGIRGVMWGLDLAIDPEIKSGKLPVLFNIEEGETSIPVYSMQPLQKAARQLFGLEKQRHIAPLRGSNVICAEKSYTTSGEQVTAGGWVWALLLFAVAKDRVEHSSLFIEDAGYYKPDMNKDQVISALNDKCGGMATAAALCGIDQSTEYEKMFVGYKVTKVNPGEVGCALTCAPYVTLSVLGVLGSYEDDPTKLLEMTTPEWLKSRELEEVTYTPPEGTYEGPTAAPTP